MRWKPKEDTVTPRMRRVRTIFPLLPKWVVDHWVFWEKVTIEEEAVQYRNLLEDYDYLKWDVVREISPTQNGIVPVAGREGVLAGICMLAITGSMIYVCFNIHLVIGLACSLWMAGFVWLRWWMMHYW